MKQFTRTFWKTTGPQFAVLLALALLPGAMQIRAQNVVHPLDPMSFEEYWTTLEVLRDAGHMDGDTRFSIINLKQPRKDLVWEWNPGASFPRESFSIVRKGTKAFEAVVDLRGRRLASWTELKGAQPNFLDEEYKLLNKEVKANPDFIAAMKKRGFEDLTFVSCDSAPPGYFATEEQKGRRVAHVQCRDERSVRNAWTRGIEGLTVVVDLTEKKVVRVVDEGVVPVPDTVADYDPASIGDPREVPHPMRVDQPLGPAFRLSGHIVEWQKWRFHLRPDQRVGTVVSTVTYQDGADRRQVLYEGHLSEIFVPYMDPAFGWYNRNFIDAGEFNAGGLLKPLMAGLDCPEHAVYFDALIAGDDGRPKPREKVICLFEREAGDMSWRHHDDQPTSRRKRDLVARSAAVLGNYDYIFDWIFQQDGSIRVAIGATGIAEAKVVREERADSPSAHTADGNGTGSPHEAPDAYGRFVDKHIVAVNHDHYFNFRIDLDVDGPVNSFVADRLVTKELPKDHPRRSIWVREPFSPRTETEAKFHMDMARPALWRVGSTTRKNHVGYPASFQLMPGMTAMTLLSKDDFPRRRAGFIDHNLWVTPYRIEERFAAGDYPTLSEPGKGLPEWTAAGRAIQSTDLVLWHTIGMHHMVRAEDWPVMPTLWHSFELRPFDFFDRNPALDLPRR